MTDRLLLPSSCLACPVYSGWRLRVSDTPVRLSRMQILLGFTTREGVPCLRELWQAVVQEKELRDLDEDRLTLEEKTDRSLSLDEGRRTAAPNGKFKLRLREVQGPTLDSLDAVSSLCPHLHSISLNCHDHGDNNDEGCSQSIRLT